MIIVLYLNFFMQFKNKLIMKKTKKEFLFSEKTGINLTFFGAIFIVVAAIIFIGFESYINEEKTGQFGDFIGGIIGSLFSLIGVILFYVALMEQRKDININHENLKIQSNALKQQVEEFKAQKEELIETRKVYEEQTNLFREQTDFYKKQYFELKEQTIVTKNQQFDRCFFSYLDVFSQLKNTLNKNENNNNYFSTIYKKLKEVNIEGKNLFDSLKLIQKQYILIFQNEKDNLSHYFKTLYRIIRLIDSSQIEIEKKNQYFKFLRSQLSDSELLLIYYNCQSSMGVKVRPYIVKYELLKHLRVLDKVEMDIELIQDFKFELEDFLSMLYFYIFDGIKKYNSIETIEDVNMSKTIKLISFDVEMKLEIVDKFSFYLIFCIDNFNDISKMIDKSKLKDIVLRQLYFVLFLNKFIIPNENEIEVSEIQKSQSYEFHYEINKLDNL